MPATRAASHVVFIRAANVGGRNVFRPARLAESLAHLGVVNIGAAGTFCVRGKATPAAIRREILAHLPFEPSLVVRPGAEILALVRSEPFDGVEFSKNLRGWVAVLDGKPARRPALPLKKPANGKWSVRLDRIEGAYALGLLQRRPGGFLFPSVVVEEALGVAATTRWWETIVKVAELLEG